MTTAYPEGFYTLQRLYTVPTGYATPDQRSCVTLTPQLHRFPQTPPKTHPGAIHRVFTPDDATVHSRSRIVKINYSHVFSWSPTTPGITKPRTISVGLRSHDAGNYMVESRAASYLTPCSWPLVSIRPPSGSMWSSLPSGNKSCPRCTGSVVARELLSRALTNRSLYGRGSGLVHGRWTTAKPTYLSPSPQ